jgi:inner membrane protein
MASLGHIAVGLAAGRVYAKRRAWVPMFVFSVLSMLPDSDVVAFALRVPYSAPFGHRGATHSFAFAALVGLGAWLVRRDRRTALFVALTVATHPLLDALTDGGLGVALLFPLRNTRYFAPFTPLPVAPIGAHMLSARGLYVVLVEAVVFLPCWLYALWPRSAAPPS